MKGNPQSASRTAPLQKEPKRHINNCAARRAALFKIVAERERNMTIVYSDTKKDLPSEQLHKLFISVGWSDGSETADMIKKYNIPFLNATLVISAWEQERLIGAVRVLSDKMFRSIIYDLLVLPEFQNKGVGKELIKRCIAHFPSSEWLVQTRENTASYYERNGFTVNHDVFLTIPCKLFSSTE